MDASLIIVAIVALALGALIGWLLGSKSAAAAKEVTESLRSQLNSVIQERDVNRDAATKLAAMEAAQQERDRSFQERLEELRNLEAKVEGRFGDLAGKAVEQAHDAFLKRADEKLGASGKESAAKLETLLQPMRDTLKRYEDDLKKFDEKREGSFGALQQAVTQMLGENEKTRRETQRLANVMVSSPKARGRWGEEQLRTILESAGLREGIDFFTQQTVAEDERQLRPDCVIRLPGGRSIIVDVKCPLVAFEQAYEEEDEGRRAELLKQHAKALRSYASDLGKKGYAAKFEEAPDFVVMFVPGEHHLSAAAERDIELIEDAYRNGVVVASTINMLALAKFMAGLWKQDALNRQAQEIAAHGRELHQRLATMAEHILNLGTHIGRAAKSYNSMIGSLDRNVLTQARRFEELGAAGPKSIPDLAPVDVEITESVKLIAPRSSANEDDAAA